jgi:uncharacterized membrane protein YwzB|tara:strand:+ start:718 stop:1095 length:378 start_codon:yes stop_codon:yes gene_type:complete
MWEVAIILGMLGSAFFMMYVSNSIDSEKGVFMAVFKSLFLLTSLGMMLLVAPASYHIVNINNGSAASASLVLGLSNVVSTQINIFNKVYIVFMFMFIVWFFWQVMQVYISSYMKRKNGGEDGQEG